MNFKQAGDSCFNSGSTDIQQTVINVPSAVLEPECGSLLHTPCVAPFQVCYVMRQKVPFGIAQIGKAFRNEITPRPGSAARLARHTLSHVHRQFLFRSREFEQMEIEYFIDPEAKCSKGFCQIRGHRQTTRPFKKTGSTRCGIS